jgi:hypothetical protein
VVKQSAPVSAPTGRPCADGMGSASEEFVPLADLAQQAHCTGGEVAQWLQDREPREVGPLLRPPASGHLLGIVWFGRDRGGSDDSEHVATPTSLDTAVRQRRAQLRPTAQQLPRLANDRAGGGAGVDRGFVGSSRPQQPPTRTTVRCPVPKVATRPSRSRPACP